MNDFYVYFSPKHVQLVSYNPWMMLEAQFYPVHSSERNQGNYQLGLYLC